MKYILLIVCMLAGCSAQRQDNTAASSTSTRPPAEKPALPQDVREAIALLINNAPYDRVNKEADKAVKILEDFETPVVGNQKQLYFENGGRGSAFTLTFPTTGICVLYFKDVVSQVSRIDEASLSESVLPDDIKAAVSALVGPRPYNNQDEVQKAEKLLRSFETPVRGIVETLVDNNGVYSKAWTDTFEKAGVEVDYENWKVTGASLIQKDRSNK